MRLRTVVTRWKIPLALAGVFIAAAVPAYAIADEIQSARTDRPASVQIGQLQLSTPAARVGDSSDALTTRPSAVQLVNGQAAPAVPLEDPALVRKELAALQP